MKKDQNFKNKKITIMGLGLNRGGLGVALFLIKAGAKVLITDLKTKEQLAPSLKLLKGQSAQYVLGQHREKDFRDTDLIIKNPGVPNNSPYLAIAKKYKIPVETDMGIFLRFCPSSKIIGVAGTKGKSTTASLIYHFFKSAGEEVVLAGNIGISVFDSLPSIKKETTVVLEISSWQLEGLKQHRFAPQTAVLTNVLPDHLDRYRHFQDYSQAEQLIYKYQTGQDFLVFNQEQKKDYQGLKKARAKPFSFSQKQKIRRGCFLEKGFVVCQINGLKEKIIKTTAIPLLGDHNLNNILATSIVALIYNLPKDKIKEAIQSFKPPKHRLEFIRELRGVKFYNDSAATTPESCLAAIHSFRQPIVLILGGGNKKMSFESLVKEIKKTKRIKKVILLEHPNYSASVEIMSWAKKFGIVDRFSPVTKIKEAVAIAFKLAQRGEIVLLSPAATSFGPFVNEFDRGRQFIKAVQNL